MASLVSPQDLATALRYGPQTTQLIRRSGYLTDALSDMAKSGGQNIKSPVELGAKLLATAILKRGSDKAQDATLGAIQADRMAETERLLSGLPGYGNQPQMPQPQPEPAPQAPGPQAAAPIVQGQLPPMAQPASNPAPQGQGADADLLWAAMVEQESGGRPGVLGKPTRYGQAQGLSQMLPATARAMAEKIGVPWRPEMMTGTSPEAAAYQDQLGRAYMQEGLERYGGDPRMAALYYHGGPNQEIWGPDTRAHADKVMRNLDRLQNQQRPTQLAMNGPMQPGMMPAPQVPPPPSPAPESSPTAAGAPPAAQLAQAAAGGNPPQQSWPTYQPRPEEVQYVRDLLANPQTFEQGRAEAMKLRQKMSQPAPAKIVEMNGVQFYVPETPGQGGPPVMIPVPQQAMTRNMPADQAGIAGPRGTIVAVDPYNNIKPVITPPTGQQVASDPGQPYRETYVPGGQNDPFRTQAPAPGYQYQGGPGNLSQTPIPGGKEDPRNIQNVIAGSQQYRDMAKTVVDDALKVKKNFEAVRTGFAQQNGPGDVVIVNGLQRLIDEGVVRGEDIRTLAQSMGLQGTVDTWKQFVTSQGAFDPAMRNKLYTIAEQLYRNADNVYRSRLMGLQPGFEELYGPGTFGKYVFPAPLAEQMGWAGQMPTPGGQPPPGPGRPQVTPNFQPGTPDAGLAEAVKRGIPLTPQQQKRARDLGLIR
jgi:hypothetical protein